MTDAAPVAPILVPFDGSAAAEAALPFAAALAGPGGRVVLLQAVPEPQPIRNVLGDVVLEADRLLALTRDAAAADLARADELLRQRRPALAIGREVVTGEAATAIVDAAVRLRPRLIVATVRGRGEAREGDLGSVADRLSGASPAPLLLVNPSLQTDSVVGRFVVGLDGSEHAFAALDFVADLATHHAVPVHLVSVIERGHPETPLLDRRELLDKRIANGLDADARLEAQQLVEGAGSHLMRKGIHASWEVPAGAPAAKLPAACRPGDILVIASHGRGGTTRWELGNVALRLLQASSQPTLLVRTVPAAMPSPPSERGEQGGTPAG